MPSPLRTPTLIGVTALEAACVVCCHGPLEGPAVADLREALRTAADLRSAADLRAIVVLDASDVVRVNSAALAVLLAASRLLQASGGALLLAAPSPGLSRALALTGLWARLPVQAVGPVGWVDPCAAPPLVPGQRQPWQG